MSNGIVLVTGAAGGQQGQTGRLVSELLLARGVPVRAFVRRLDERAERLRALGAEIFVGDLLDLADVQRAAAGVSSVYFAYPVQDGLLEATAAMAFAARRAGVTRLVDLVMLISSPDAPTPRMRQNFLSEQIFEWAGIGAAHLRATVFHENVRALAGAGPATQGTLLLPWGSEQTVIPLVAGQDVARVAVGLLTADSLPAGSNHPVVGDVLTVGEIAATWARVLGREVRYVEIPDEDWRRGALARGLNAHAVEHLAQLWRSLRSRRADSQPTPTIEAWGGQPPTSFEAFLRATASR